MTFAILRHFWIPEQKVSAIIVFFDDSTSRVYVEGKKLQQRPFESQQ